MNTCCSEAPKRPSKVAIKLTFANSRTRPEAPRVRSSPVTYPRDFGDRGHLPLGLGGIAGVMIKLGMRERTTCGCEEEEEASNEGGYGYTSIQTTRNQYESKC